MVWSEDGLLAGPNWDADLNGFEVDPKELADRLLAENERIREVNKNAPAGLVTMPRRL